MWCFTTNEDKRHSERCDPLDYSMQEGYCENLKGQTLVGFRAVPNYLPSGTKLFTETDGTSRNVVECKKLCTENKECTGFSKYISGWSSRGGVGVKSFEGSVGICTFHNVEVKFSKEKGPSYYKDCFIKNKEVKDEAPAGGVSKDDNADAPNRPQPVSVCQAMCGTKRTSAGKKDKCKKKCQYDMDQYLKATSLILII